MTDTEWNMMLTMMMMLV